MPASTRRELLKQLGGAAAAFAFVAAAGPLATEAPAAAAPHQGHAHDSHPHQSHAPRP
ncbi:hypothetical protein AB0B50_05960 [Streptomyces sp. NPDC041068]|uniref:hypothetical protein n=1 Tax=Streptomyces sp. NPDC041068 TaxID=3155130 RepID=UPI0033C93D55